MGLPFQDALNNFLGYDPNDPSSAGFGGWPPRFPYQDAARRWSSGGLNGLAPGLSVPDALPGILYPGAQPDWTGSAPSVDDFQQLLHTMARTSGLPAFDPQQQAMAPDPRNVMLAFGPAGPIGPAPGLSLGADAGIAALTGSGQPTREDPQGATRVTATYDSATGKLTLVDLATGKSVTADYHSGGPLGDAIRPGTYHILEHGRKDEFRLEPLDATYGDDYDDQTGRSLFRLHGPGRSAGCISAKTNDDWDPVRDLLKGTSVTDSKVNTYYNILSIPGWPLIRIPTGTETLKNYGTLVVK
jgi:hypothetical protein